MINITYELMCLLVFMIVVHRMLKWLGLRHWGKQHLKRRHYEDQRVSSKVQETKKSVVTGGLSGRGHTRLSGAPGNSSPTTSSWWHYGGGPGLSSATPNCPVQRVTAPTVDWQIQRLVAHQTRHRTVRCLPPDCSVCCRKLQLFSLGYNWVGAYIYFTEREILSTFPIIDFDVWRPSETLWTN